MGHVEWNELKFPNGLTPSSANPNLMFHGSLPNFGHFSSMCFKLLESRTLRTKPSKLAPLLCQINNSTIVLHLYIHSNLGIIRKWQSTLCGTPCDPSTNLLMLHLGHTWEPFKVSQKKTQPLGHAWIES
jgi:hypothetical protein